MIRAGVPIFGNEAQFIAYTLKFPARVSKLTGLSYW